MNNQDIIKIAIIGIGNTLMGDDGVGSFVAKELKKEKIGDFVEIIIGETAGMALIKYFYHSDIIFFIDAIDITGAQPGEIFRFSPDDAGIVNLRSNNIHGMGIGQLVANARLLGLDNQVIIYGIQIEDVRPNDNKLTSKIMKAALRVKELILEDIKKAKDLVLENNH